LCMLIASCTQLLKYDSMPALSLLGPLKNVKRALCLEQEVLLPLLPVCPARPIVSESCVVPVSRSAQGQRRPSKLTMRRRALAARIPPAAQHCRGRSGPDSCTPNQASARGAWLHFVLPSEPANTSARRTSTTPPKTAILSRRR
jgi:hypothetical protein